MLYIIRLYPIEFNGYYNKWQNVIPCTLNVCCLPHASNENLWQAEANWRYYHQTFCLHFLSVFALSNCLNRFLIKKLVLFIHKASTFHVHVCMHTFCIFATYLLHISNSAICFNIIWVHVWAIHFIMLKIFIFFDL